MIHIFSSWDLGYYSKNGSPKIGISIFHKLICVKEPAFVRIPGSFFTQKKSDSRQAAKVRLIIG